MSHQPMPAGICAPSRGPVGRRLVRVRAGLRRHQLDAALARGVDPWSRGELMVRAARLGSLAERRSVAAGLVSLVELAECRRPASPYLTVRHRVVLEQREALLALAERLGRPEPVEIAVAAQVELLVTDSASPVYRGGSDPAELAEVVTRCLERVAEDVTSD